MGEEITINEGNDRIKTTTGLNYGLEYVERKLADKVRPLNHIRNVNFQFNTWTIQIIMARKTEQVGIILFGTKSRFGVME